MNILGISAFYHDSAACIVQDGKIISASQEERFTRLKHDQSFPVHAINSCLGIAGISMQQIDYVVFYEKPFLKFERLLETYLAYAPKGIRSFMKAMPVWIKQKIWIKEIIKNELSYSGPILFPEHHESHAASAFFPSPFREAAILTVDGVGEWTTTSYGVGRENSLELLADIRFPHSLGLLYSAFTYYLGFKVNSGEYKVMGLAPYGEPRYVDAILDHLIDVKSDGSFRLNMDYFAYGPGLKMTNARFHDLFGAYPRRPETELTQKHMDIARSIQEVVNTIMVSMARHIRKETGQRKLCLAGGVALNCVANSKILFDGIFDDIWIQPASGDAGGALGAALACWYQYLDNARVSDEMNDQQLGTLLGPSFTDDDIRAFLNARAIPSQQLSRDELLERVSELIHEGNVVGWFQGKMEYGPRALGSRSILGDARSAKMQSIINQKIKFRESFRPFAPSILQEKAGEYFETDRPSPYMLLVADVSPKVRRTLREEESKLKGIDALRVERSDIPAITHVDYSARLQTVDEQHNPLYHGLISRFYEKYGCPVIINTSFNVRGEPIVCTPEDAFNCFMNTHMDYLILGSHVLTKNKLSSFTGYIPKPNLQPD